MNTATRLLALSASAACALHVLPARADDETRAELQEMRSEIQMLRKQVKDLSAKVAQQTGQKHGADKRAVPHMAQASEPAIAVPPPVITASPVPPAPLLAAAPPLSHGHGYFERKPGDALTFYVPHGEITGYGNLDVDIEGTTKGTSSLRAGGVGPVGNMGWQPAVATNISYVGVRGFETLGDMPFKFIYQLETQIDIAAQSGSAETNSSQSNVVKGGLTSRNSFVGLADPYWGSLMIGKTDAPYKQSTIRMNPFVGMLGDYGAIMGNTGGDNRVEFGTRLDHSIWYESPKVAGFLLQALYSPGQNRSGVSDNIAAGESDCTGGNVPGSGGSLPIACNDGAFSDAVSVALSYTHGPLYVVAAYERHQKVNRSSDLTGEYANPPAQYFTADVADEDAAKIGLQYTFPSKTVLSGIYEDLHRYVPPYLAFQNERQRTGSWLAVTQKLSPADTLAIGWAHAGRTPGDPGQHNTSLALPPLGSPGDGTGGADADNTANLYTVALSHDLGTGLTVYANWAWILNGPYAHYALGAGGRSITVDCHDASDASGGLASNPHCWAGGHPEGISLGLRYRF